MYSQYSHRQTHLVSIQNKSSLIHQQFLIHNYILSHLFRAFCLFYFFPNATFKSFCFVPQEQFTYLLLTIVSLSIQYPISNVQCSPVSLFGHWTLCVERTMNSGQWTFEYCHHCKALYRINVIKVIRIQ